MARRAGALLFLPALVLLQAGSVPCPAGHAGRSRPGGEPLPAGPEAAGGARARQRVRGAGSAAAARGRPVPAGLSGFREPRAPGSLGGGGGFRGSVFAGDRPRLRTGGSPLVGECGSAFGSRPVSATHRLGWLAPSGEGSSCADGRGDPVVPVADQATWAAPGRLSPPGAPAAGIRLFPARAASAGPGGQPPGPLIERRGGRPCASVLRSRGTPRSWSGTSRYRRARC
jgi:hypothetical protein